MLSYNSFTSHTILTISQIDSTNNYAHTLIDKNESKNGLFLIAKNQTNGKGQRANTWYGGLENEQLAASLILHHQNSDLQNMFILNMAVSLAVVETLKNHVSESDLAIKWSNDILLKNKKVAGILIENIVRGSTWTHSIIGIGLNVNNHVFPENLPHAISLYQCINKQLELSDIASQLHLNLNTFLQQASLNPLAIITDYNKHLLLVDEPSSFVLGRNKFIGTTKKVDANGLLHIQMNKEEIQSFAYGSIHQPYEFL
jgi:BirA family transcriptional regulator, biotin operon repressor / biotin---[acetyl-CoA-carboxylase] ligase